MKRKPKIVKTYGARRRTRLPIILAVLAAVMVFGVIIAMNIYDEYHTYRSSDATVFETVSEAKDGFLLTTETKTLLGKVYAGFAIRDEKSSEILYQCPDLYLVKDLESIGWAAGSDSVLVTEKDGSVTTYERNGKRWEKQPERSTAPINTPPAETSVPEIPSATGQIPS